ncbi:glycosyltransferase family 4 protein [Methylocystis iwaonis]|uniref:glycosyltransferase family 4 protein n=1 Tax=Methylocystis iwaonis TaxID=2885079 RepID=UPI002E7BBF03|nr:glycosyltransferase family 4 protein [Methylocystis iwaonis]
MDKIRNGIVYGWVYDPAQPQRRWLVDLFVDGVFRGQTLAHMHRPDLVAAKIGDGAHAFVIDVAKSNESGRLSAVALGTRRFSLGAPEEPPSGTGFKESLRDPYGYLRATFQLDAEWPSLPNHSTEQKNGQRRFFEALLDGGSEQSVRNLGGYQALIQHRMQYVDVAEPILSRSQYEDFLHWYISDYGAMRRPFRAPLGATDIEHLSATDSISNISNAQRLFADCFAASTGETLERAFLWCAYEAAALGVEDCLILPTHQQMLGSPIEGMQDVEFPLTHFMRLFIRQNPFLASLPKGSAQDRSAIYFIIVLFAATAPHYLHFVPKKWREALFKPRPGAHSLFEEHSRRFFADPPAGRVKNWERQIEARHFRLKKNEFRTRTSEGSRVHAAALPVTNDELVDIQLIGPFTRALGVGQSCRRLANALEATGYRTRFCDHTLDHPNQIVTQELPLSRVGPARINVVHLNLDEFPDAVAYSADIFSGAYNVIFPYLEIVPPALPQLLALKMVDETWAASRFIFDALSDFTKTFLVGSHCDDVQGIGRNYARCLAYNDIAPTDFVFLTAGDALSGAFRKNFLGTALAFRKAFPENPRVRLVIKTHSIDKVASAPERAVWRALKQIADEDQRIVIIDRHLGVSEYSALIEGADALVSLHRAEGLGYHILEAMHLGTPVVATAYSGTADFCNEQTAFVVPHRLVPVPTGQYVRVIAGQTWAEPDIEGAAQQLRSVYSDIARRDALASAAKKYVAANFAREAFVRALSARIVAILG